MNKSKVLKIIGIVLAALIVISLPFLPKIIQKLKECGTAPTLFLPAIIQKLKECGTAPTPSSQTPTTNGNQTSRSLTISFLPMGIVLGAPTPAAIWTEVSTIGASWARTQIRWDQIEKTKGKPDYSSIDTAISNASKTNTKLMTIVNTSTKNGFWAVSSCNADNTKAFCVPNDLSNSWNSSYGYSQTYYNYVKGLASHTKGKIDHFVIQNEVASPRFWSGTPEEYLKIRKTAYKAVHDANPNGIVIDNGLASPVWGLAVANSMHEQGKDSEALSFAKTYFARSGKYSKPLGKVNSWSQVEQEINKDPDLKNTLDFINAVFKEQDSFDWFNFHFYDPVSCYQQVIDYIKLHTSKPVIMNEGGFADSVNTVDPNLVAGDLVKLNLISVKNGLKQFEWYPTQENPQAQDLESIHGLFDKNAQILPAGNAWKFLNSLLVANSKATLSVINGNQVYKIEGAGKITCSVWNDKGGTLKASDLGKSSFQLINVQGEKQGNKTEITTSSTPQFLQ